MVPGDDLYSKLLNLLQSLSNEFQRGNYCIVRIFELDPFGIGPDKEFRALNTVLGLEQSPICEVDGHQCVNHFQPLEVYFVRQGVDLMVFSLDSNFLQYCFVFLGVVSVKTITIDAHLGENGCHSKNFLLVVVWGIWAKSYLVKSSLRAAF